MSGKKAQFEHKSPRPLVFISHHHRDARIAEAFSNLLTDASGGFLRCFRSSDRKGNAGISFGQEWFNEIMAKLDEATDVVALLTNHSVDRPWILYEVGAAKGKLKKQVFGLVIGVPFERSIRGPFAQLHNSADDEDSLTKVIVDLIRRNSDAEPRPEAIRHHVTIFRDSIKRMKSGWNLRASGEDPVKEILQAVDHLARHKMGALIVLERHIDLGMFAATGVLLEAIISKDLLVSLFTAHSGLNDGAVIVRKGRIAAAGCFLPLSLEATWSNRLATRHRAAAGVTEEADCLSLIVSAETGAVSVAVSGELIYDISQADVADRVLKHFEDVPSAPTTRSESE